MNISRGRCMLATYRELKGWTQEELSTRTGYDPKKGTGYSQRTISWFEQYDGQGKGRPMPADAMYLFTILLELPRMEALYANWSKHAYAE